MIIQVQPRQEICYNNRWYKAGELLEVPDDFDSDKVIEIKQETKNVSID